MRRFPPVSLLLAGLVAIPSALAAQTLVGTVREAGTGHPVIGAMVRLHGPAGATGARFLTADDGRYRIVAPGPGRYTLRVDRIGFAEAEAGPITLAAGETRRWDVEVETAPIRLEGLAVETGRRRCPDDGDLGETQLLWDEARKALAAATWTEREAGLGFEVARRLRRLDPSGRVVREEQRSVSHVVGGNSVRTLEPADLAEDGYVRERDRMLFYYGPDAEALLSDEFLATHCFSAVADEAEGSTLVGLRFEPVDGRDTTDIEGVLWMDGADARLDRVEFRYTGLAQRVGADRARGAVRFLELADGRWVVRDWYIQAPLLELRRGVGPAGRTVERVVVASLQEQGSEVLSVTGRGGVSWRSDQPVGGLRGVVFDSTRSRALDRAVVRVGGRAWRTTSDEAGRWELEGIPPGRYVVEFDHPRLDSLGVDFGGREVEVRPDAVVELELALPPLGRLLAAECGTDPGGVVVGFVRGRGGAPLAGVRVRVVDGPAGAPLGPGTTTDGEGAYRLCGLPAGVELRVEASEGSLRSVGGEVRTRDGEAVRADLRLVPALERALDFPAAAAEPAARPAVSGTALDARTRAPLAGVEVSLTDASGRTVASVVTDDAGRFRALLGAEGLHRLGARRVSHAPVEGAEVEVGRGTRRLELLLGESPVPLDEVVVEVEGRSLALDRAGFFERRDQGLGTFFERADIEAFRLLETGDLANRVPALVKMPTPTAASLDTTRRYFMFRGASRGHGDCLPAVFVDGALVREGGDASVGPGVPTLDEIVSPGQIEGIELYSGVAQMPTRFAVLGAACGVVVVWTR